MREHEALTLAHEAGVKEHCRRLAEQKWADTGTCGFATIKLPKRSLLAEVALRGGFAFKVGREVVFKMTLPPGIRGVQSASVNQAAADAVVASLTASGFADLTVSHWID